MPKIEIRGNVGMVERRGRIYACTWAETPTPGQVAQAWREDRRAFRPYDQSSGAYL